MTRLLRRAALRQDGGATAVEFALLVPFVLALLTGLLLLGFRSVYVGLAQNAAKDAVQTAVLPAAGTRALSSDEVCDRALQAVPAPFRPAARSCNGGTAPTSATGLAVQVCPPACTAFSHAARCTALPAARAGRVRGLSRAAPQVLAGTFFTRSPEPSATSTPEAPPQVPPAPEAPAPAVTPPRTAGATLSPDPVPVPQPPALTPQATPSQDVEVPLPVATVTQGVGREVSASASPALPALPRATPSPRRPCTDDREGRLVAVSVTWRVGALEALSGITLGLLSQDLATVRGTATGRRE